MDKIAWMLPGARAMTGIGAAGGAALGAGSALLHNRNLKPGEQRASVLGRAAVGAGTGAALGYGAKKGEAAYLHHKQWGNYQAPQWASGAKSKGEAKSLYRTQALKSHPDRGGNVASFQNLNAEWDKFQKSPQFNKLSSATLSAFADELKKIAAAKAAKKAAPKKVGYKNTVKKAKKQAAKKPVAKKTAKKAVKK
jgi:hypothetical protein